MNIAGQFPHYAPPATDSDTASRSFSMLQLRAFLGREWRLIAVITVLTLLLGIAYVIVSPNKYTARTDMIIDSKKIVWVQSEMSSESRVMDDAAVESEIETTKSEKVAKRSFVDCIWTKIRNLSAQAEVSGNASSHCSSRLCPNRAHQNWLCSNGLMNRMPRRRKTT